VTNTGAPLQPDAPPFWSALGSEDLNRLVDLALAQNLDLEAALPRIEQARAQIKVAGAALYPIVDASGGHSKTYQDPKNAESARGLGSLSYEVDLWGKNRNQKEAAAYRAQASEFDHAALRLIVIAEVANFYAQILGFNDRIAIANNNLRNAEEVLRIIEARYTAGRVSGLEVSQQRVAVNGFRTTLTTLVEQRATTANALAVLVSQPPQNFTAPEANLASLRLPVVNLTPPASLLTARPDIAGAEAGLRAANADIGAARAAFFPSLMLGVDASIAAGFGNPAASAVSLASSVLAPIFSGGRLTGNLANVTARQEELAAEYRKTVLTAFKEVEDALALLKSSNEQAMIIRASVTEAQTAYNIAKARFDAGAIDYLTLLETQRSLFQAQDSQVSVEQGRLEAFVQLRKALAS
jgi:NodT family efflux transporter outer membrane factor (OMF) lipoprotein